MTVAMGGLTAKLPDAAIACRGFPLCGRDPLAAAQGVHVQSTHRVLAFLLLLHLIGVVIGLARRREESRVVARAAYTALGLVLLQIAVAASMILLRLPPVLRSLHEAVGVSVWLGTFTYAYLALLAAREARETIAASDLRSATLDAARGDTAIASARGR
jgi:heme A synthase